MDSINTVVKQILPNGGKKALSETPAIKMKPAQTPDFTVLEATKPEPIIEVKPEPVAEVKPEPVKVVKPELTLL